MCTAPPHSIKRFLGCAQQHTCTITHALRGMKFECKLATVIVSAGVSCHVDTCMLCQHMQVAGTMQVQLCCRAGEQSCNEIQDEEVHLVPGT